MDQDASIKSLIEKSQEYLDTRLEIAKLRAVDKSSDALSTLVAVVLLIFFAVLFLLFVSIGLALYIGSLIGSAYTGFFIVAAFYGLLLLLIFIFRERWIKLPLTNLIIKKLLK
ncbi:MAG TPA: phage holin family protein [Puia sp.]|nr:phage holin family protein [Puia sp.]